MSFPTDASDEEERRLRALLRAAVPEAPAVVPPARRSRPRGPAVAVLAAAAAVAAIAVVPLVVDDGDQPAAGPGNDETTSPSPDQDATVSTPPEDRQSLNPYRGGCREPLAPLSRVGTTLPDLDLVRSARICVDPELALDVPAEDARDLLFSAASLDDLADADDGVVDGSLARFDDELGDAPEPALDDCATVDYQPLRSVLELELDDRTRVRVPTDPCTVLTTADGREVDGTGLLGAYLAALDDQRATASYPLVDIDVPPVTCASVPTQAPVRPSDVAGGLWGEPVLCADPTASPQPLSATAQADLEAVLARAPEPVEDAQVGYDEELPYVVLRTSRYDVVHLRPTEGGLELDSWQLWWGESRSTVVPIDLDDLT